MKQDLVLLPHFLCTLTLINTCACFVMDTCQFDVLVETASVLYNFADINILLIYFNSHTKMVKCLCLYSIVSIIPML